MIEDPISAVLICGTPCLVKVPQPARFALHKLIVSQERTSTAAGKKRKDVLQAEYLLKELEEDRPGDIEIAKDDLAKRGAAWIKKVKRACMEEDILVADF